MNKFLYIVNPVAGKGKGLKALELIADFHKNINCEYKVVLTEFPKHATQIAKDNSHFFSHIIAGGGDGTINEVINGIDGEKDVIFSVLPIGTGNDLIKSMKFPNDLLGALEIIHSSKNSKVISGDLGLIEYSNKNSDVVNSHYFANCLGIGFDAYVGYINSSNKKLSGVASYVLAVVKGLYNLKMLRSEIGFINKELKNIKLTGKKSMFTIGKGVSSGGGFYLTPKAKLDDGFIDISIFDELSRFKLLQVLPKALVNKLDSVSIVTMHKTKSLLIYLEDPYFVHCDGEIISNNLESAKISCIEKGIKLLVNKTYREKYDGDV